MATSRIFHGILSNFPKENLRLAFAYGSGVFQQKGHADINQNMLDFVFAVDNPKEWHLANIEANPNHYSVLKYFGPKAISYIQDHLGAGVYYNTLVPCEGRMIKYGVISTDTLTNDLLDWETLYISGRLHKPVRVIHQDANSALQSALSTNLQSACHTALLLLSDTFNQEILFQIITSLSYTGDFRMSVGEDRNKVKNIVDTNIEHFIKLYSRILEMEDHLHWNRSTGMFEQSLCPASRLHHLNLLPKMMQNGLVNHRNKDGRYRDAEEVLRSFAHDSECSDVIRSTVSDLVKRSSFTQSAKGILSAGVYKSVRYSSSKLHKMWKSY